MRIEHWAYDDPPRAKAATAERVDQFLRERPARPPLQPIRYRECEPMLQGLNWRGLLVLMLAFLVVGWTTVHMVLPPVLRAAVALWERLP